MVGLDCLDGTPLLDLKPYFASTDAVPDAVVGWHATAQAAHNRRRTGGIGAIIGLSNPRKSSNGVESASKL